MFLNNGILKKLMKQAYKEGLAVAQTDERIYIAGGYWEMDVRREFLPKQILAQIIELAGELPEVGKRFTATKNGNQFETEMRMSVDTDGFDFGVEVTKVFLSGKYSVAQRILQDVENGRIYLVNNVFVAVADNAALDGEKGEHMVAEPMYHPERGILWANNVGRFHALWSTDENHQRLLNALEQIDLTEDVV